MEIQLITPQDELYPSSLRSLLGPQAPNRLQLMGKSNLLTVAKLALFCSAACPGSILTKAYDLANGLRQNWIAVMSGFHAPMEKEWLQILLSSATPIVRCPARDLSKRRLPPEDNKLLAQDRLLLLSFTNQTKRTSQQSAFYRNVCMAAMADKIFVAHASPASKTETLCRQIRQWGKTIYTFMDEHNTSLIAMGAKALATSDFLAQLTTS